MSETYKNLLLIIFYNQNIYSDYPTRSLHELIIPLRILMHDMGPVDVFQIYNSSFPNKQDVCLSEGLISSGLIYMHICVYFLFARSSVYYKIIQIGLIQVGEMYRARHRERVWCFQGLSMWPTLPVLPLFNNLEDPGLAFNIIFFYHSKYNICSLYKIGKTVINNSSIS